MPSTLSAPVHSELLIRKSRFIGCVQPMADRATAQTRVTTLKAQHPGAVHVCWALVAGGASAAVDDGEPSGTAGRPMLEVLRHQDLDGVLATVVRYFGGVKLGTGGLMRAYTDAVAQALAGAVKVPLQAQETLRCVVPYPMEGLLRRELEASKATIIEVRHGALVDIQFALPTDEAQRLMRRLDESGQGRVGWLSPG